MPSTLSPIYAQLPVKPEVRAHRTLKLLQGVVPIDVMVHRKELAVLPEPGTNPLQRVSLTSGGRLGVTAARTAGNVRELVVELTGLAGWQYDTGRHRFEWVEPDGRRLVARAAYLGQRFGSPPATVDDLALLGGGGSVPWGALGWYAATQRPGPALQGRVEFLFPSAPVAGGKLVLVEFETKKVEAPFEFRDLPLP